MAINFAKPDEPAPKRREKPNSIAARAIAANAGGGLLKYEAAVRAIADAKSVDEVKDIRDTAEALRAAARVAKNKQAEIDMAEIRIRGERRLGELMELQRQAGLMSKGAQGTGSNQHEVRVAPEPAPPTLAEAGIDKNLADRARKFAAIPENEFEGILADRRERFQQEDERVTVNLMEAGEKHVRAAEFDPLQSAWDAAGEAERDAFLARNNLTRWLPGKASEEDHNCADHNSARTGGNYVDGSAARADRAGQDQKNALAGQVEPRNSDEIIDGNASLAAREGEKPLHSNSSSALTSSRATGKPEAVSPPPLRAPILKPLSKADQFRLLRPNCLNPEVCAGSGKQHCHACTKAKAESEAA